MKKLSNVLWGIVLIAVGAILALRAFGYNIDIFFDGWWTLFIIIPCTVGLFTESDKTGNIIGIAVGLFLLLGCQNIISFAVIWKLMFPAIIILIGIKLIFSGTFSFARSKEINEIKQSGPAKAYFATFSGQDIDLSGAELENLELTAAFGGIKCDLRNAIIKKDAVITVSATFGGIDIFVPDGVNIKKNCNCIFGGISSGKHRNSSENTNTIYISGTCLFGGVDIK